MPFKDALKGLRARFEGGALETRRAPRYPDVAIEIAPDRITGVRLEAERKTGTLQLRAVESRDLPDGAVEPSLTRPNILVPEPVTQALGSILAALAPAEPRVSLLIPDHVARVALLSFATVPRTRRDLLDLVLFRMAKSLPFKPEEAVTDLMVVSGGPSSASGPAGVSVLAVFIHRAVVEQYEALLGAAGFWPGLVGLSTFELYNLVRARLDVPRAEAKDALLLNLTPHYLSLLIVRHDEMIFYRCKPHSAEGGSDDLAGIRREIYTSLAFYQEKLLGRGIARALVRSCGVESGRVREVVAGEVGCEVELLELPRLVPIAGPLSLEAPMAERCAPAVGAVAGRRA
ncbi:MAG TPA: hypothetical protein VFT43_00680 [Candidatus Polarisedimenticolia bacterium]|nr:hypothetical protein [Candidatus Polarisedimenticolia bacterium]